MATEYRIGVKVKMTMIEILMKISDDDLHSESKLTAENYKVR